MARGARAVRGMGDLVAGLWTGGQRCAERDSAEHVGLDRTRLPRRPSVVRRAGTRTPVPRHRARDRFPRASGVAITPRTGRVGERDRLVGRVSSSGGSVSSTSESSSSTRRRSAISLPDRSSFCVASLPPAPIGLMLRWRSPAAALLLAMVAALLSLANHGPTLDAAKVHSQIALVTKQQMIVANQGAAAVPDSHLYNLVLGGLTAGEYREAVRFYGIAPGTDPPSPDAAIVRLGRMRPVIRSSGAPCTKPNDVANCPAGLDDRHTNRSVGRGRNRATVRHRRHPYRKRPCDAHRDDSRSPDSGRRARGTCPPPERASPSGEKIRSIGNLPVSRACQRADRAGEGRGDSVGGEGFEPTTSCVSSKRSNQLS